MLGLWAVNIRKHSDQGSKRFLSCLLPILILSTTVSSASTMGSSTRISSKMLDGGGWFGKSARSGVARGRAEFYGLAWNCKGYRWNGLRSYNAYGPRNNKLT